MNSLPLVIAALKEAYANAHQCDLRDRCPGCMAGYALEAITGRKWTQEECESPQAELTQLREERDEARFDFEGRKASEEASVALANSLMAERDALRTRAETAEASFRTATSELVQATVANVAMRDALEKELAENKKLKLGAVASMASAS